MTGKLKNITSVARHLGIRGRELESCGPHKAKINLSILERLKDRKSSRYILVSAISPTPLGEGKTVTTIGLSMALNKLKYKSVCTLRQSSLGPLFGSKGVATGGGAAGVLPTHDVNLHLTGDTHAVGVANNLLVSFIENSIFHGNKLAMAPLSITMNRCLDVSDRSLRHIRYSLKSGARKFEIETGFQITAASEIMSILALSRDFQDMRRRLSRMVVARNYQGDVIRAKDLKADGMMAAVLKDAIKPNLVQTSEHTPCLIHTGPFANVSIGCSSIIADRIALGLCDYVVTESGFGVDCGGEKFFDIKCRYSGLKPNLCVLVCSVRGLKAQSQKFSIVPGQKINPAIFKEDWEALNDGIAHLKKQIENIGYFGIPVIVALNVFANDLPKEMEFIKKKALSFGAADCVQTSAWRDGSKGALKLAQGVVKYTHDRESFFKYLYDDNLSIAEKIEMIAKKIYGAKAVEYLPQAKEAMDFATAKGFGPLPICIAKTQFSLSHDESLKGAPTDFILPIKDIKVAAGAGFILAHTSLMQTMPGLPLEPRGEKVDIDNQGMIKGLA